MKNTIIAPCIILIALAVSGCGKSQNEQTEQAFENVNQNQLLRDIKAIESDPQMSLEQKNIAIEKVRAQYKSSSQNPSTPQS